MKIGNEESIILRREGLAHWLDCFTVAFPPDV